jgi:RHS repeat-associated protein
LTKVIEDPAPGLNYETDYQYNALGNLICAVQKGTDTTAFTTCASAPATWRPRSFVYDSLSRLLSANNPESGTISYTYDTDASCSLPYNVGDLVKRVDARGKSTCYAYDQLHRLTQKSYNDSTPTAKFGYDGTALSGCTPAPPTLTDTYPKARRTAMCDGSGATSWKHDPMGRVLSESRIISGQTKTVSYAYNLDGSLRTLTYPGTAKVITYTYGQAARALTAKDLGGGINYVTNATYAAHGALSGLQNGTSAFGRLTYNSRLQPLQLFYTTGTIPQISDLQQTTCPSTIGTILHRAYNFGAGTNDSGNVLLIRNCRDTNRTQNFDYDNLNRVWHAYTTGTNWGETFTVDAWGNLTNKAQYPGKTLYELLNAAPASNQNQLPGFGYDAAGNMTSNGSASYSYDAENRLTTTSGWTYVYDGDGKRVKKVNGSAGTLYWTGTGSDSIAESSLTGTNLEEYIFFGGRRVARRDVSGGAVHYYFADHLGSADVITSNTGAIQKESDYYPYGGEIVVTGSDANNYKFTGKERDSESGNDYFGLRYYGSSLGRFLSPDSIANDWELRNPQTWNRYTYARNNPLIYIDPDGAAAELLGDEKKRQQELEILKQSVGNKDAASRLYINEVKDGDKTRYFVGIKGDVGDFMNLSETSHDLANVVQDKQVVEFGVTDRNLAYYGGAETFEKGEDHGQNQNVRVLVNPNQMNIANLNLGQTVLGVNKYAGQMQQPPWRIRDMTTGISTWHEFGHAWGMIHRRLGGQSNQEANAWENRMRKQMYGPLGPDNAQRINH